MMDSHVVTRAGAIRYPWTTPPAPGETIEVAPGIHWARMPLPMALDHVNVYALDDGDGWTLVDTGFDSSATRAAWESLLAGPLSARPVRRVIVTHYHPDHVGLAGWFKSRGAELLTTRTSWLYARMLTLDVQDRPGPETLAFWQDAGMPADMLAARAAERPFNFADCVAHLPPGFTRIREGDVLGLAGQDWHVRCGDGHAPEHATFWSADGRLVLGGDQLLPSISANLGVYPAEPAADPVAEWMASCARMGTFATDDQLVLPGHKLPFTGLPLRLTQMIDNHLGALSRLIDHLAEPHTIADCFVPIFKRDITGPEYGMALVEAVAHVNHLWRAGRLTRRRRADGAWLWQAAA